MAFLGHVVENGTIVADPEKTKAVSEMKPPTNVHEVRRFVGFANYFRRYLQGFSTMALPLHELTHKHASFIWGRPEQQAWEQIRDALITTPVLQLPDWSKPFIVQTDASDVAIGGVLMQQHGEDRVVVAYRTRVLSKTQCGWPAHERELWAIVDAVADWRPYIENTKFIVETDHKPLIVIRKQPNLSHKQARWVTKLMEYDFELIYRPGPTQEAADCLSRPPGLKKSAAVVPMIRDTSNGATFGYGVIPMSDDTDPTNDDAEWNNLGVGSEGMTWTQECSRAYNEDEFFKRIKPSDNSRYQTQTGTGLIHLVESDGSHRLCVPTRKLQLRIISECHDTKFMAHPGENRLIAHLRRSFFWPRMRDMAQNFVKTCERCQKSKSRNTKLPGLQQPLPVPMVCWEEVSIDFMTKLPRSQKGNDMLMVVVDRLSKQAHFIPVKETYGATEMARVYHDNIFRHHGIPKAIISDRDPRFTAELWRELWEKLGTRLRMSTADHPQTDGQTEVVNRTINHMLRTTLTNDDWESRLVDIEFAYNSLVNRTTGKSPFEITYGYVPLTPATLHSDQPPIVDSPFERFAEVRDAMITAQQASKTQADQNLTETIHQVGDLVLLAASRMQGGPQTQRTSKHKWQELWRGPYAIIDSHGDNAYTLDMPSTYRGHTTFNIRFLKPWFAGHEVEDETIDDRPDHEGPHSDHFTFDDAVEETDDVIEAVAQESEPEPPVRRSQRGLKPSRRLLEAATEGKQGGVKQTLLHALKGQPSTNNLSILRNFPISDYLGTFRARTLTKIMDQSHVLTHM